MSAWRCGCSAGVGILLVCVACQSDSLRLRNNEVLHPTPANAPSPDATVLRLTATDVEWSQVESAAWRDAREKVAGARTTLAIGDNREGPTNFGRVRDVAVTPEGDVLVLDDDAQEVRVFDSAGRFVQRVGGLGDGPTEFRYANGIELFGDRRLIVSSRGSRQFKLFRETETGWDLDRIAELPLVATDMCAMDTGRLFLTGFTEDENLLVHEFVGEGVVSSFVEGYQAHHWFLRYYMSKGLVGCLKEPVRVAFAFELLPTVRLFAPSAGAPAWTSRIGDFIQPPVIQIVSDDGQPAMRRGKPKTEDGVASLHGILPGYLLLQVARYDTAKRKLDVRSYLVDAETGAGAYMGDAALPPVLSAFPGGFVAMFEDPYPRLEIRVY